MASDETRLITRRRSLALIGATGAGFWVAGRGALGSAVAQTTDGDDHVALAAKACTLTAEQEEGPFYVALDTVREDIVLGQPGLAMTLRITIINSLTCRPLRHAAVDIWHANASGVYSDIGSENSVGQTYLRGVQFTDKHGLATFRTIFPGHYEGRTTHIHARVHVNSHETSGKVAGGHIAHTGQMFPPEAVYEEVYALSPYSAETAAVVSHAADRVWTEQHGGEALMTVRKAGGSLSKGVIASVTLAVNPNATPALIGATSGGSGPTGGPPGA